MGGIVIILLFALVILVLVVVKTSNNNESELLRKTNTAASSTTDNETQTTDNAPNDGSTPATAQPAAQGAPVTREELDNLLFQYHGKLFSTIVKAILMAMFISSLIGGFIGLIIFVINENSHHSYY